MLCLIFETFKRLDWFLICSGRSTGESLALNSTTWIVGGRARSEPLAEMPNLTSIAAADEVTPKISVA